MAHGKLTAQMARMLSEAPENRGVEVLFDHGRKEVDPADQLGKIVTWLGDHNRMDAMLSELDIAVIMRDSGKVCALIEVEETTDKPKVLLGDVFATLLGDRVTFQGERNLPVGPWTTLIVMVHDRVEAHQSRMAFLQQEVDHIRSAISRPNATIGSVVLASFSDTTDLKNKLKQQVGWAIQQAA